MKRQYWAKSLAVGLVSLVVLNACDKENEAPVPEPQSMEQSTSPLKVASAQELSQRIRDALYASTYVYESDDCSECAMEESALETVMDSAPSVDSEAKSYSQTNTQEVNVDEADRVEYNGTHLFMVAKPSFDAVIYSDAVEQKAQSEAAYIRVLARQEDGSLQALKNIDLPEGEVDGLYLSEERLVVMMQASGYYMGARVWDADWAMTSYHPEHSILVYDISSPEQAQLLHNTKIEGQLVASRRIGNSLYVASRFGVSVPNFITWAFSNEDKQSNLEALEKLSIEELLPDVVVDGGEAKKLYSADSCLVPQEQGLDTALTSLLSFDIQTGSLQSATCVNSGSAGLYLSTDSLFLYTSNPYARSVIHQFELQEAKIAYQGSASVAGGFGWSNASYRFSEHEGYLRVISTENQGWGSSLEHHLSIFQYDGSNELNLVSHLPNAEEDKKIGKPGEDIYAVRYFGDKAYIVTFERIDPLYTLDLADPNAPQITGELEIPGYSAYLHPIGEDLLLGVGQQVDSFNWGLEPIAFEDVTVDEPFVVEQGAKVSLFEVSDPKQPIQLAELVFANSMTPVEWEPHSFTSLLHEENTLRISMPIETWDNGFNYQLKLLEVDIANKSLSLHASVQTEEQASRYVSDDRTVIHQDDVYYVHGNEVWHLNWNEPSDVVKQALEASAD